MLAITRHRRPGPRRTVPRHVPTNPTPEQAERLQWLLDQGEQWILRTAWNGWLHGSLKEPHVPITRLTRDQLVAAISWLRQQRHDLHNVVNGTRRAPDGWLESTTLYSAMQAALPKPLRIPNSNGKGPLR